MAEISYKTANRTKILAYLIENQRRAVTVSEILEALKKTGMQLNQSTVYRYLNQLCKEQMVMKFVASKGEKATFQYTNLGASCQNHLHMQCRECGKRIHLDCGFMEEINQHIKLEYGFLLECQSSILYGLCSDCRK